MKFSIIVPAYNSEDHIRKALDSIKSQVFTDYELIVICDSCKDKTADIAREYTDKVYEVINGSVGASRNDGLDKASGDYILFMDDDDWWLHEYVLTLLDAKLNEDPNIDVLAFSFIWANRGYAQPLSNGGHLWPAVWSKCWRRSIIGDCRFPAKTYDEEPIFVRSVFQKHPNAVVIAWDNPLYYYNFLRPGSVCDKLNQEGKIDY